MHLQKGRPGSSELGLTPGEGFPDPVPLAMCLDQMQAVLCLASCIKPDTRVVLHCM